MDWQRYREPVKVNERALADDFIGFCYMNGGHLIRESPLEDPNWDFRCRIPGVGDFSFTKRSKPKRIKIVEEGTHPPMIVAPPLA